MKGWKFGGFELFNINICCLLDIMIKFRCNFRIFKEKICLKFLVLALMRK